MRVLPVLLASLALAPAAAAAPPQLLAPITVTGPNEMLAGSCAPICQWSQAAYPRVATDAVGETAVVYSRTDGAATGPLLVTIRPPGGAFAAPQTLETGRQPSKDVAIASNDAGDMVVVWSTSVELKASFRPAGGAFGPTEQLSQLPGALPVTAVDGAGNALAAWISVESGEESVAGASRIRSAGQWTLPKTLSTHPVIDAPPALAANARGDAVVAFTQSSNAAADPPYTIRVATGTILSGLGPSDQLGGQDTGDPDVAINAAGESVAVWVSSTGVQAARRPPGGTFGSGGPISDGGTTIGPQVGIDDHGDAMAAWWRGNNAEASTSPEGGSFPAQGTPLGAASVFPPIALSTARDGTSLVVWGLSASGDSRSLSGSVRAPGGAFGGSFVLDSVPYSNTAFVDSPAVAFDGVGNGAVVWRRTADKDETVLLAPWDGAGPMLRAASFPGSATAGVPASFSVDPLDVWSPVTAVHWAFGDGDADGPAVSHAFTAQGAFDPTVTATDALGNASVLSRPVGVVSAGTSPADTTAPRLAAASLSRRTFGVGRARTAISARRAKRGTTIRFRLDEAASVRFTVARRAAGRRSKGRCVKPTRKLRRAKRCTRYVKAGAFTRARPAGAARVAFSGRIGSKPLRRGRYRLVLVATDAARNASKPVTLAFRIVR
jgi:PKD domain-containing protein